MVICKYFQNGNCRFGTKCLNEHFDVKPIIKTEVEAALKGSQWPLSCFGPFKEKPNIPNFIEDQSFEEIRYLCYEAKKQNCFPAFHQQFTQQVMEAQNKMKTLLTLNRDVIEVVTNLYNSSDTTKKATQPENPFSLAGNTNSNQSSLFGSNPTQSNPFSNVGGSVFRSPTASNTTSIFGRQSSNTNSMIGQSSFRSGFGNSQGPLFAQQTSSFGQSGGNLFSLGSQQQQQQQQQQSSVFGGNTQQTSLGSTAGFGAATQTNLFGQPQQQQQQQQQSLSGSNLFSQQSSGFGTFGQTPVQPQASGFGVQQPSITTGLFSQQQPTQQSQNVFVSSQPQQSFFGQQPNQQQNAFGMQQSNNLFGAQVQPQQQNLSTSSFGNVPQAALQQTPNALATSTFGNLQQQQQPENLFSQTQQQNNFQQLGTFTVSNQQTFGGVTSDIPFSENLYSKMEALKPEEIEAFKADKFEIGKIPTNPPPRELVQFK